MAFQTHLGVDIGSSSIKFVQLEPGPTGGLRLSALALVEVPASEDPGTWVPTRAQVLKNIVREAKVSSKRVAFCLPESQVYTRVVQLPYLSEPELTSAIRWQAEQYVPIPLADVVLKHQVMAAPEEGLPGSKMKVLLVAAPNTLISNYMGVISGAGLETVAIETEVLSVTRALADSSAVAVTTLLVHLGAQSTNLAVVSGGELSLAQTVGTGSEALARALISEMSLGEKQAEEYKKTYGLDQTQLGGKIAVVMKPVIELIVGEIKKTVAFYETSDGKVGGAGIKRVVLSGGGALLPGLVTYLTESLGLEVQLGDPFLGVNLSTEQRNQIGNLGPIYTAAVGLASKLS